MRLRKLHEPGEGDGASIPQPSFHRHLVPAQGGERCHPRHPAIGRRSLFIFCVHTVELTAIPWYLMPQKFAAHPVLGMVLQFTLSLGSTLLICELLVRRRT